MFLHTNKCTNIFESQSMFQPCKQIFHPPALFARPEPKNKLKLLKKRPFLGYVSETYLGKSCASPDQKSNTLTLKRDSKA